MNVNMPMSNTPTPSSSSGGSKPFYQIWIDAVTKPNPQTFAEIASSPNASAKTALIWLFVVNLASTVVGTLFGLLLRATGLSHGFGASGFGAGSIGFVFLYMCIGGPILSAFFTLFIAVLFAIFQWIAKRFGGQGTYDQLAFALGAIGVPLGIVSALLTLVFIGLNSISPFISYCFYPIFFIVWIYAVVLNVMAVKGVHQIDWLQAVGTIFIPAIVFGCLCGCVAFFGFVAMGAALRGALQQFQPGGSGF